MALVGKPGPQESIFYPRIQAFRVEPRNRSRMVGPQGRHGLKFGEAAISPFCRRITKRVSREACSRRRHAPARWSPPDVPGCRDILKDRVNGLRVAPRDSKALADAIKRLAVDADLRRKMGAAGRRIVEREFSDEIVSGEILKLYEHMSATEKEPKKN